MKSEKLKLKKKMLKTFKMKLLIHIETGLTRDRRFKPGGLT